jgi:hypothetical protein
MADSTFRPSRGRDPYPRDDVDPLGGDAARDPLAELARIIGQNDRNEFDRDGRRRPAVQTLDEPLPAADRDWAADDGYAAPDQYADEGQESYQESHQENYVQPRLPEPYPAERGQERYDDRYEDEQAPPLAGSYAEPDDRRNDERDDEPRYRDEELRRDQQSYDARYRDEDAPPRSAVVRQPAAAPQARQAYDDQYQTDGQWDGHADHESTFEQGQELELEYADEEEYDDETPSRPRRRGAVVMLAMLGLVLVGAGGAFAYRAMFGGAILAPSVPPVIKANDGPNKIVPNRADGQAAAGNPAGAAAPGSEKLVSREEQPVPIQPPNAPPRVVTTIPVPSAPGAAPDVAAPGAIAPAPPGLSAPPTAGPKAATPPLAGAGEPKKIHTVPIRPDQGGNANAAPPAATAPAPLAPAPSARPKATDARPQSPPKGGNAPLAIVPVAQGAAPAPPAPAEAPRSRTAHAEAPIASAPSAPAAPVAAAPSGGGGYAVQVTSQRSEAEAQTEFRSLQAKYPGQLGSRQPIIHRADLGDKGTFYRALVGPFPSSEAAAAMCSSLKAAGGSCLVQKN